MVCLADIVFEIGGVEFGPGEIAGKEDAPGLFDDFDHLFLGRDRHRADMLKAFLGAPGGEQFLDHPGHLVVLAAVGYSTWSQSARKGAGESSPIGVCLNMADLSGW